MKNIATPTTPVTDWITLHTPYFPGADCQAKLSVVISAGEVIKMEANTTNGVPCKIYYTTDGTTPTADSTEYTAAITLPVADTTYKAIAIGDGYVTSDVVTFEFEV